jgi:hypothetical protein
MQRMAHVTPAWHTAAHRPGPLVASASEDIVQPRPSTTRKILIARGQLQHPILALHGAADNDAGIYFEDNAVKCVVSTREAAKVYYVSIEGGKIVEKVMEPERIE